MKYRLDLFEFISSIYYIAEDNVALNLNGLIIQSPRVSFI